MKEIMGAIITVLGDMRTGQPGLSMDAVDKLFKVVRVADSRVIAHVITVLASIANLCDTVTTSDTQDEVSGGRDGGAGGVGGRF